MELKILKKDIAWWKKFKKNYDGVRLSDSDFNVLCNLHAVYFNHSFYKPCSCNGGKTIKQWAKELDEILDV